MEDEEIAESWEEAADSGVSMRRLQGGHGCLSGSASLGRGQLAMWSVGRDVGRERKLAS